MGYASPHNSNASLLVSLAKEWHNNDEKVCFIGHSWGGDTVMDAARDLYSEGIEIDLVVTLDPVGRGWYGKRQKKRSKQWINIYIDYKTAPPSKNNNIARLGGAWGDCPNADINISYSGFGDRKADHADVVQMFALAEHKVIIIT